MSWHEGSSMNVLTWMNYKEWRAKSGPNPSVLFDDFMWSATTWWWWWWWWWWWCGPHTKSSSGFSLVHILSSSSSKSGPRPSVFYDFMLNRALATVSCTFCQPHLPKDVWTCQFFTIFMLNRALATVSCAFCRPHLPKVVRDCQILQFYVNSSSRYTVLCAFCRHHLQTV